MKSFPHYSQHDVMDCGPTCLRMVSAFYGKRYSLEGLREKSFITREGVSMLGISEAAEKIGFRSICVQVSYEMLQEAPLPCIVHWNQQHFVVVYRMNDKHVWVADPGAGKLKYTREEFCRCWLSAKTDGEDTGVALLLEPTPEFYAQEDEGEKTNYKGFGFLYSYLRPYKQLVGQLLLGLLLGSMIQLMLPFLTQSIVDFGINNQNLGFIYLVLIAQLMLSFSSSAVEFIRGWILLHLGTRINIALISDFLIKMMKLPMGYFDTKMTGDILQRINDHTRIQNFLTGSSLSVAFSTFNILIFGIVLLVYSGMIFLIFMGGSALYISYVWLFMKKRAELDHKRFAQQSANQSTVVQLVNGMQEIKLSACEQQKRWEWERIQARLFKVNIRSLALRQYQDSGAVLINQTKNIVITGLVASLVVQGEMTLGMMLSVQYIIGQLNSPINELITFARDMQDARLSTNRLGEVRDSPDEEDPTKGDTHRERPADRKPEFQIRPARRNAHLRQHQSGNRIGQTDSHRRNERKRKDHAGEAAIRILSACKRTDTAGRHLAGELQHPRVAQTVRRGDAGRVHLLGQHCRQHRPRGGAHRQGTPAACGGSGKHTRIHRGTAIGIQHPDRPGRARIEPGTETAHTHRPRRVQEPGIHLLRRSHQRTGCQQRAHHHGEPAALLRRKDIGSGGPPAEYRAECRPDSGDRAGTDSGNGDARGTDSEGRKVL
jgi:hypothetical protein